MKQLILTSLSIFVLFCLTESCTPQEQSNAKSTAQDITSTAVDRLETQKEVASIAKEEREEEPVAKTVAISDNAAPVQFDENKYYRITSQFTGEGMSLNILNDDQDDKVNLGPTENVTGQAWKIKLQENGYYRLSTEWRGEGKSLDIYNDDATDKKIWIADTGDYSGQNWKIVSVGNGYYRLSSEFLGEGRSLDVLNDGNNNKVRMIETGDYSGQLWTITVL